MRFQRLGIHIGQTGFFALDKRIQNHPRRNPAQPHSHQRKERHTHPGKDRRDPERDRNYTHKNDQHSNNRDQRNNQSSHCPHAAVGNQNIIHQRNHFSIPPCGNYACLLSMRPSRKACASASGTCASIAISCARISLIRAFISCSEATAMARRSSARA